MLHLSAACALIMLYLPTATWLSETLHALLWWRLRNLRPLMTAFLSGKHLVLHICVVALVLRLEHALVSVLMVLLLDCQITLSLLLAVTLA